FAHERGPAHLEVNVLAAVPGDRGPDALLRSAPRNRTHLAIRENCPEAIQKEPPEHGERPVRVAGYIRWLRPWDRFSRLDKQESTPWRIAGVDLAERRRQDALEDGPPADEDLVVGHVRLGWFEIVVGLIDLRHALQEPDVVRTVPGLVHLEFARELVVLDE